MKRNASKEEDKKKDNYRKETMQICLKERQELTETDRKEKRLEKDRHKAQVCISEGI